MNDAIIFAIAFVAFGLMGICFIAFGGYLAWKFSKSKYDFNRKDRIILKILEIISIVFGIFLVGNSICNIFSIL